MPRRGRQGASLFSSLPSELRQSLRQRICEPSSVNASVEPAVDYPMDPTLSGQTLLRTQPDSESEDEEESEDVAIGMYRDKSQEIPVQLPNAIHQLEASKIPAIITRRQFIKQENNCCEKVSSLPATVPVNTTTSRKKRFKLEVPKNNHLGHPWDCTGLVPRYTRIQQVPSDLVKYFRQRGLLFPEYNKLPLLLDRTGWFSVTPQPIAAHIAERCRCDVIVDAFCGVGGNAIAFAKTCERVIAIDNDITRLRLARHNALHYGVAERIEFVLGDYIDWARSYADRRTKEMVDVVFLSPPWGGIDYLGDSQSTFPLSAILPIHGRELFQLSSRLTPNIAYYLPRNTNMDEVGELARELKYSDPDGQRDREWVEVEEETVRGKVKALTVYFGGLVSEE
ncbi:uncharacterized protein L203_102105 [Cryptococcus depauperatus CBS 7841]|uniref:Trimethylguanosine synthase n=1 Tax=Cryptococcus depauperatus CBS 7841 TaxID=1295531 RepID=A0AAJ8JR18_9TREE